MCTSAAHVPTVSRACHLRLTVNIVVIRKQQYESLHVIHFPCVTDVACILMLMKTLDGEIIMSSGKLLKLKGNAVLLFCFFLLFCFMHVVTCGCCLLYFDGANVIIILFVCSKSVFKFLSP